VKTDRVYHFCRNPRCGSKLAAPVSNPREAFCTRGCHSSFYRNRCLVCDQRMERKSEHQKLCGKRKCRNAFRVLCDLGRYYEARNVSRPSKNVDFIDPKEAPKADRPWRIVAGQELTPTQLRCATVGGEEAVEAINRTNARHWRENCLIQPHHPLIQPHHPPVNILGGYKFPDAPTIDLSPTRHAATAPDGVHADSNPYLNQIPADLSIPTFLKRDRSTNIDIKSYRCAARRQSRLPRSPPGSQKQVGGQATGYRQKRCHSRRS